MTDFSPIHATIHSTYSTVSVGLFAKEKLLYSVTFDHKKACVSLLSNLELLLKKEQIELSDLKFIAVNQGPGPYTTLRITLSIADGLAFATGIPLVGVDGFAALFLEIQAQVHTQHVDYIMIMQNAFCREVFYAIHDNNNHTTTTGYISIDGCIEKLQALGDKKIVLAGNGVNLFAKELAQITIPNLLKTNPLLESPSLEAVGQLAYKNWESGLQISSHLLPLYLKRPSYHMIVKGPSQQ